ncbi:hypothetical protein, partial [Vibrio navarrensis]|uniref:hypothetical protein n=1 Tax=Vibrio navarrensis TaxID=29495 RepID=UPI001D03E873
MLAAAVMANGTVTITTHNPVTKRSVHHFSLLLRGSTTDIAPGKQHRLPRAVWPECNPVKQEAVTNEKTDENEKTDFSP